ncbi:MAG: cobalt-precorrin-5B (C(1))-methyltransferase [Acidimicrobiales bacterium]
MTYEPELSEEAARRRQSLRTGWTTGTCASAAAKAAAVGLLSGQLPVQVEVGLPGGRRVSFSVEMPEGAAAPVAAIVKDAGDDPDCTDGAHMTASVEWASPEIGEPELRAGSGIGVVTKPGLGLAVGMPAINPVPRRMILQALAEVTDRPTVVTFSVPGGEEMAAETTNDRLGIVGGISILGTTGIVRPFSTASYRASVVQQVDVAAAQGERQMVLATGHRSEMLAARLLPELDPVCLVEIGDFTGIALRRVAHAKMTSCYLVAMAGKLTKLASGVMMTHFHRSDVDTGLLGELALEAGASGELAATAAETATARHFAEACVAAGDVRPLQLLTERARAACVSHAGGALDVTVWMSDFEGERVLAYAGSAPPGGSAGSAGSSGSSGSAGSADATGAP